MTQRLLRTARRVASETGQYVAGRARGTRSHAVRAKAEGDFVTAVDAAAEALMRRALRAAHPDHGFVGEESGAHAADADLVWIVDPIDGTSNFSRGLRPFAVSLACLFRGQPVAAAVHCEPDGAVYSAALELGAFRGNRRIETPTPRLDAGAIIGVQWLRGPRALDFLPGLLATGTRVRNHGCTVTQLCDVALGRLDANLQEQGKIWDIAAAGLIASEAGARFTDWSGAAIFPFPTLDGGIDYPSLAAAPPVHRRLVRLLGKARKG